MKKILLIIFVIAMVTCKKKHSCRCASTVTDSYGASLYPSKTVMLDEKYSKKQIKAICKTEEDNINITYRNVFTNNGTSTARSAVETVCTIE